MKTWDLAEYHVEPQKPEVIGSTEEGRAILVNLSAGDEMKEHQVKELATVIVISGEIEISTEDGQLVSGCNGTMVVFQPSERHSVRALENSRFLLLLAPWSLEEHSSVQPWKKG